MALMVLILLVGTPLIELWLMIEVGGEIGGLGVIALSLATAAAGLMLVRAQGLQVIEKLQNQQTGGPLASTDVGQALIHGLFLLIAGGLLMFPGFLTDTVGGLLLIPPVRLLLGKLGLAGIVAHRMSQQRGGFSGSGFSRTTIIIDGEVVNDHETRNSTSHQNAPEVIEGEIVTEHGKPRDSA